MNYTILMKNSLFYFIAILFLVSCVKPTPRKPVTQKTSSFMKESVSINKKIIELEEEAIKDVIKKDSLSNYTNSANGFWYKYNVQSSESYLPQIGDQLFYTCEISDLNNTIIYSSDELGLQKYIVDKQELPEGLRNGLKLMKVGDNVTFLFPSHKIYGYLGDNNKIGSNQPLIYNVQLNKINKQNEIN